MNKELYIGTVTLVLAFALIYAPIGYAQNLTTNASNAAGNTTASANQTASELGQNASSGVNSTGETLGEMGKNASEAAQKIGAGATGFLGNISEKLGIGGNSSK
jgi:predicted PurR-regulated permease PerM